MTKDEKTQIHRGKGHVKVKREAEIEMMWPQDNETKKCWQLQKAGRGKEGFSSRASRDLDFGLLASRNVRLWENTFLLFVAIQFMVICCSSHRKLIHFLCWFSSLSSVTWISVIASSPSLCLQFLSSSVVASTVQSEYSQNSIWPCPFHVYVSLIPLHQHRFSSAASMLVQPEPLCPPRPAFFSFTLLVLQTQINPAIHFFYFYI